MRAAAHRDPWCLPDGPDPHAADREMARAVAAFAAGAAVDRVTERAYAMLRRRVGLRGGREIVAAQLGAHQRTDAPLWGFAGLARAEFDGDRWTEIDSGPVPAEDGSPAARPGLGVLTLPVLAPRVTLATAPGWAADAARDLTESGDPEDAARARALDLVRDVLVATDVIAIELAAPHRWARLTGGAGLLGQRAVDHLQYLDLDRARRPRLYAHPLDWWRDGNACLPLRQLWPRWGRGACILDAGDEAAERLLTGWPVVCDDAAHAAAVHETQQRIRRRMLAALPKPPAPWVRTAGSETEAAA